MLAALTLKFDHLSLIRFSCQVLRANVFHRFHRTKAPWRVSSFGRVQDSLRRVSFGYSDDQNYRNVYIDFQAQRVHRLVARTFLGPAPSEKPFVNHLDGNRENNCVYNLAYVSASGNISHSFERLTRKSNGPRAFQGCSRSRLWKHEVDTLLLFVRCGTQSRRGSWKYIEML